MARYSFFVTLLSFVLTICINDIRWKSVRRVFSFTRDRTHLPINKVSSKPRPSYRNFHQKSAHIPSGRSFPVLQLLPYNRKEKGGGKTNLFLLHFHFLPIWNCESRRSVIACPLSLSLWNDIRLARGQKKSEDKALSSSSDLPEIARQLPCTAKSAICFPWYLPQPSLDPFETWIQTFFLKITSKILIYIYWWAISEFWLFKTRRRRTA